MEYIRDVIVVKAIEKNLGRLLTADELDSNEPFLAISVAGVGIWISVPTLIFPADLLQKHIGDYQANNDLFAMLYE